MRFNTPLPLLAALPVAVLLSACGTSGTVSTTRAPSPPPVMEETSGGYFFRLSNDGGPAIAQFKEPIDQVWDVVFQAYQNASVEVGTFDPASRTIGNRSINVVRQLGTLRATQIVECGRGGFGVSGASGYRINMSIISTLSPTADGGTRMETSLDATGTPVEGASRATLPCSSTGRLERLLAESIASSLSG